MNYPEHEKLHAIKDQSQSIGEFIEWLGENGYSICERRDAESRSERVKKIFSPSGRAVEDFGSAFCAILEAVADNACLYWPTTKRLPESLLADYFKIDQNKLEDEKRAMLDHLRTSNAGK